MTDQNTAAPPGEVSTGSLHQSLAALREAHLVLRRALANATDPLEREKRIRDFLTGASKAGAYIEDPRERRVAQGILDFWSAELATSPQAQARDYTTLMLAPFEAAATSSPQGDQSTQNLDEQRALIRLAALARQWRDSGKRPGYLLYGDTVKEAARFADRDADLAEFVAASQDAVSARKKIFFGGAAGFVVAALIVAAAFYYWQFSYLPAAQDEAINDLRIAQTATPERQTETLRWLSNRQLWLPPYDFSGAANIKGVRLPELRLWAANFSRVNFDDVEFHRANLNAVSFSGSELSFDGNGRSDFKDAVLWRALFRNAKIANTSFAGADLYRAIFDRAVLCNVDFAGASLRSASFWAATLDEKTEEHLKNVAWWQAVGWPWKEVLKLAVPHQKDADVAVTNREDEARNTRLKQSRGFREDMRVPRANLLRAAAGSRERVFALNDMAWTLAIWGVDIAGPKSPSDPCAATGIPANGLQAAEQAVCIATKLNSEGEKKGTYKELLSNLRDTLAYIQMQRGEMDQALQTFEQMGKDDPAALENSESTQFRYAIAQYNTAGTDKNKAAAAVQRFTTAVNKDLYQPSHELQTLRDYIFPVKEFVDVLKASANRLWPEVPNQTACPAPKSAGAK